MALIVVCQDVVLGMPGFLQLLNTFTTSYYICLIISYVSVKYVLNICQVPISVGMTSKKDYLVSSLCLLG